jgi:hypothetical protein
MCLDSVENRILRGGTNIFGTRMRENTVSAGAYNVFVYRSKQAYSVGKSFREEFIDFPSYDGSRYPAMHLEHAIDENNRGM